MSRWALLSIPSGLCSQSPGIERGRKAVSGGEQLKGLCHGMELIFNDMNLHFFTSMVLLLRTIVLRTRCAQDNFEVKKVLAPLEKALVLD